MKMLKIFLVAVFVLGIVYVPGSNVFAGDLNVFSKSEKLTFKGDVRLRHEYSTKAPGSTNDSDRERLRFRFGASAKVNDFTNVGFGLASGSSDGPTSTNQTLEQEFQSKSIWLDYAYADFKPHSNVYLIGGKFKSIFQHTDMLFDSDIRFDGFAAKVTPIKDVYVSGGYFPIDNRGTHTDDIYMLAGSVGLKCKCPKSGIVTKLGVTYFDFVNIKGATRGGLAEEKGTNSYTSVTETGALINDYNVVVPSLKISYEKVGGLLAEYAQNGQASHANDAYRIGGWIGSAKAKKPGEFRLLTQFSFLQTDAFPDGLPDADFSRGGTNGKGWEAIFDYVIAPGLIFSVDYYKTRNITGALAEHEVIQTDIIVKF